jgi:hypothetical protein
MTQTKEKPATAPTVDGPRFFIVQQKQSNSFSIEAQVALSLLLPTIISVVMVAIAGGLSR